MANGPRDGELPFTGEGKMKIKCHSCPKEAIVRVPSRYASDGRRHLAESGWKEPALGLWLCPACAARRN